MPLIAIDGPGGSGKSTVSKALAERLGLARLDTGAMYRAVALLALRHHADLFDGEVLAGLAQAMDLEVGESVMLDGEDVSDAIRTAEIDRAVPHVARQAGVREELVRRQRAWAQSHDGGVVEGRDITTVVFPSATLKVFLTASVGERAQRRTHERQWCSGADAIDLIATERSMTERDTIDATRDLSPLAIAEGALIIDSTGLSVEDVVTQIVAHL